MVKIDMPMPKNCDDCPMMYYIRTGVHEGCAMCNAMEARDRYKTETVIMRERGKDLTPMYFVDPLEPERPEGCPIVGE